MSAPQEPSVQLPGKRGYARWDEYASARCSCGHLRYANQAPGDPCQFCACTSHVPAGDAA